MVAVSPGRTGHDRCVVGAPAGGGRGADCTHGPGLASASEAQRQAESVSFAEGRGA